MATKLNKKRNTGFVFEALIREATKAILAKDETKRNTVVTTIKESFAPGTELRKELDCYRALSSEDTLDKPTAEKLIFEVRRDIGKINEKKLVREKNTLVSRINKRQQMNEHELEQRKQSYQRELEFMEKSNYVVYSEENKIDDLVKSIINIIKKETNA